jgi:phage terminase Nu1 subunit (DNA packaging protein)
MLISVNKIAALTGLDRRTVSRRLEHLTPKPGPNRALLYESRDALPAVYGTGGEGETLNPQLERAALDKARRLDLEQRMAEREGQLLPAELVLELGSRLVAAARSRMLAIPSKVRGRYPDLEPAAIDEIDSLVREALTELGDDGLHPDLRRRVARPT